MTREAFIDHAEEAAQLWAAANVLRQRARELLADAAGILEHVDDRTLNDVVELLRSNGVTGRGDLVKEINRRKQHVRTVGPPVEPGQLLRRARNSRRPWPTAPAWVYMLYEAGGDLLYVGMSAALKKRLADHTRRGLPWVDAQLFACASIDAARALEGHLIHHHQPPWNIAGKVPS